MIATTLEHCRVEELDRSLMLRFDDVKERAFFMPAVSDFRRLTQLTRNFATVALELNNGFSLQRPLEYIAAFCMAWVDKHPSVVHLVQAERERQDGFVASGRFYYNCSTPNISSEKRLAVLTEELGEVAREVDRLQYIKSHQAAHAVRKALNIELIQVAAVCVAWLEALAKEGV